MKIQLRDGSTYKMRNGKTVTVFLRHGTRSTYAFGCKDHPNEDHLVWTHDGSYYVDEDKSSEYDLVSEVRELALLIDPTELPEDNDELVNLNDLAVKRAMKTLEDYRFAVKTCELIAREMRKRGLS